MAKRNSINIGVLILVVVLAVGVLAVVSTGAVAANGSVTVTCSDTDGGQAPFMKGTCTGKDAYGGRPAQIGSWTDSCDSPSILVEWYCDNTGKYCNKMSYAVTGLTCVDGALVQSCTPTNGGVEICGNGIDEDCSGADLACPVTTGCTDADADGYGAAGTDLVGCSASTTLADCNDANPNVHPGAAEICGDGFDQDCDGADAVCPTANCTDTDGGQDFFTKGTCTGSSGVAYTDSCYAGKLKEYYCKAAGSGDYCEIVYYNSYAGKCMKGAWINS